MGRPRFEFHAGVDGDGQGPRPADPHRRARAAGRRRRRVVRRGARLRRRDGAGRRSRGALGSVTQLAVTVGILLAYVAGALAPHESLEYACGPRAARRARGAWRSSRSSGRPRRAASWRGGPDSRKPSAWLVAKRRRAAAARALTTLRGGDDARARRDPTRSRSDGRRRRRARRARRPRGAVRRRRRRRPPAAGDRAVRHALPAVQRHQRGHLLQRAPPGVGGHGERGPGRRPRDDGPGPGDGPGPRADGRRPAALLAGSLCGMAAAAALLALHFLLEPPPFVALVALFLYIAAFSLGLGPVPWLLMPELLPTRARGAAAALATVLNWSCSFLVTETASRGLVARTGAGPRVLRLRARVRGRRSVSWRPRCRRRRLPHRRWTRSEACFGRGPRSPRRQSRRRINGCVQYRAANLNAQAFGRPPGHRPPPPPRSPRPVAPSPARGTTPSAPRAWRRAGRGLAGGRRRPGRMCSTPPRRAAARRSPRRRERSTPTRRPTADAARRAPSLRPGRRRAPLTQRGRRGRYLRRPLKSSSIRRLFDDDHESAFRLCLSAPAGCRYLARTPSSCASKSTVALSVSISQMTSPAPNAAPSSTFHFAIVPCSIVGESAGCPTTSCDGSENQRAAVFRRAAWRSTRVPSIVQGVQKTGEDLGQRHF